MKVPTREAIVAEMQRLGYAFFVGDHDLNIIGLRVQPGAPNKFDDLLCVLYFDAKANAWRLEAFACTTDPGTYYLENPIHASGTAVLAPAQNRSAFTFGKHHGDYECLVQCASVKAYLDADKDAVPELQGQLRDLSVNCGIHIHRANADRRSTEVGKWSAGCQVIADPDEYDRFLALCHAQVSHGHGSKFTYTLLDWPAT